MLRSQVHHFTPFLFVLAIGCEREPEPLIDTPPPPTTFVLKNALSQKIYVRAFSDAEGALHFTTILDGEGRIVQRFRGRCEAPCGPAGDPIPCRTAPQSEPIHELEPGQTIEETWDLLAWVPDPNAPCSKQIRVPREPHVVQFCWSYALEFGDISDEVCETYEFTPGNGERIEHTVVDEAPHAITFEIENARGVPVDIAISTGCSGAAGWVAVQTSDGKVLPREYDCGSCLCDNLCALCDCIGPQLVAIDNGEVVAERWNGLYLQGQEAGASCGLEAIARGSFTAHFCWLRKDTRPNTPGTEECADVPFTLGTDETLRFVIR